MSCRLRHARPGSMVEGGGGQGETVPRLLWRQQAAARGQHFAQVLRQAFVNPEQVILHGLLIIRRGQIGRTAVLSVPRMHVLVREQAGCRFAFAVIDQRTLGDAAVVRLVVFQSEVRHVIAQAEQEVVIAIVMRAEKFVGLFDQILVVVPDFLRRRESGGAVGGYVHLGEGIVGQFDDLEKFAGDYRRIDQRGQGRGLEC